MYISHHIAKQLAAGRVADLRRQDRPRPSAARIPQPRRRLPRVLRRSRRLLAAWSADR